MTIYDIAVEAQVSISTVSRVLNSPEKVSKSTRVAVERVLKKHNYVPNAMARGLVRNSLKAIGILIPDMNNMHFSISTAKIEDYFFNLGYTVLICHTGNDLEKKIRYVQSLAEKKVDALILMGSAFHEPELADMMKRYLPDIPIMISNSNLNVPNAHAVLLDQTHGMRLAVAHLLSKGYEDIYFLHANHSFNTKRKIDGFLTAAREQNIPLNPQTNNLFYFEQTEAGAQSVVKQFSVNRRKRTALIFYDDYNCIRCCNAFMEAGISVPGDLGIISYDNTPMAAISYPRMTAIDAKLTPMALILCNALHDLLQQKPIGNCIYVQPDLVVRQST